MNKNLVQRYLTGEPARLDRERTSRGLQGGDLDTRVSSDGQGGGRRKESKHSRKKHDGHRRKGSKRSLSHSEEPSSSYPSSASSSSSDSETDSESESLTAPTPTLGPKQKRVAVWKPTNHCFRGVCNY